MRVKVTHLPTGLSVSSVGQGGDHRNQAVAMQSLLQLVENADDLQITQHAPMANGLPSDEQIIIHLATYYGVTYAEVVDRLCSMDLAERI